MAETKTKFRDHLEEFALSNFGAPMSKLNDVQRTDALTLCYLCEIRNNLLPQSVPEEIDELKSYITDNKSDRTVDFLYREDNGHVTIIQTKHRAADKREQPSDFESFRSCLQKLCPATRPPKANINQRLLDLISNIEWDTDTFSLIFLSLAKTSDEIERIAESDIDDIANSPLRDISERSEIQYLSEDELNKNWRDVLANQTGTAPSVNLRIVNLPDKSQSYLIFPGAGGITSYITALPASQIHELYVRHRDRLFNLNIRNYIGDTKTNKGVIESALEESENFFLYNNGISTVSTNVSVIKEADNIILQCKDFSVINGAQTFRSISKAYSKRTATGKVKDLRVLVRVTELNFHDDRLGEVLDKITRYNNTQNAMKLSDFRSNDAVQSSLVKYVSGVPAWNGRRYVYKNKRTQASERNAIIIKLDEFCRAIYAYQFGPADMFGGLAHLYNTEVDGGYVKLFGKDIAPLSQAEFERLFAIWLICSRAGDLLKEEKQKDETVESDKTDTIRKNALERKFLVFFALGEVFREVCRLKGISENELLKTFAKPRWQEEEKRLQFVDDALALACDVIVQTYIAKSSNATFMHRNFFREQDTLTFIRDTKASRRGELKRLIDLAPK